MNSVTELAARLEKMEQEVSRLNEVLLSTEKQRDQYHRLYLQSVPSATLQR